MKFGLHWHLSCTASQSPVQRYRDTLEQATHAEALGFESAWPVEQHFQPENSIMPAPLLLLAALAERTERLRLGIAIILLSLAHPLRIAEEIATLDVLSNGRVEFGVGRGSIPTHFTGFGIPQTESRARFIEAIEMVQLAWTKERLTYHGRFFNVDNARVVPKPVQRPHPPIRVASNSRDTFELMGRLGYPIFAAAQVNPFERIGQFLPVYREARRAAGHPDNGGEDVTLLTPLFVGESPEQIREVMEPSIRHFIETSAAHYRPEDAHPDYGGARVKEYAERVRNFDYERTCEAMAIFETPEACAERLHRFQERFNMGRVICWFNPGGQVPQIRVMRSMELFAAKVMPLFA
jgi:alkanesulfonate monooxygenase SsuD/methylene tetrahydromethanopterin reductase-like flavin-dependent oxidoreductase (luciferase family)